MRGFLHPAVRPLPTGAQSNFQSLQRGRRTKLARAANTTLVKADQWARGDAVSADVSEALERAARRVKPRRSSSSPDRPRAQPFARAKSCMKSASARTHSTGTAL